MVSGGKGGSMRQFEVAVGGGEWEDAAETDRFTPIFKDMDKKILILYSLHSTRVRCALGDTV